MKYDTFKVVFAAAIILLAGALLWQPENGRKTKNEEMTRYTATFLDVFDTRTEIVGYGETEEEFTKQVEKLKEKLVFYHNLYDIYHSYEGINNVKTINDNAGVQPVAVDKEIIELLKISKDMYKRSEGQVNVAMGSVLSIWHDFREKGMNDPSKASVPEISKLEKANLHTDIDQIIIEEDAGTVFLEDAAMSLDIGGIGKGYAVQKTAEYAREIGIENMLISVGGNVCAIGGKIKGEKWKIGIQNPDMESEEQYSEKVNLKDLSVVTSGNYQRYYEVDGKRYCHIIDPDTLMPADYAASVTIISKDSGLADAMSTAVYNMPLEQGTDFVNRIADLEAMWIMNDGTIHYSDQFEQYLEG